MEVKVDFFIFDSTMRRLVIVKFSKKSWIYIYLVPHILPPVPFQECIHYKGIAEYGMKV